MTKFYVTTPIYYANAKPHIGSAYPTIAADVIARWHQLKGDDTYFLTGTAEHGTKIANSAEAAGQTPQEFVDVNSTYFKEAWKVLNIKPNDFIRTTEQRHADAVNIFFAKLKESGKVYEGEYEGLYCVGHEAFIKESELDANGNCPDHGKPPEKLREKNWFFKLSEYGDFLKEKINSGELNIEPESRRNEILSFIDQGLEDITISRKTAKSALSLPWDPSQTIYVWLDELFNYCSAIGYGADEDKFKHWWPADVHIVGKDIIKFHCVIWPALLHAIGEELPKKVFAHGFFTVNEQKISKSLGNAIDPVELVKEYGADPIRYYLLREIPFGADGDFSSERLKDRYNSDLANGLGNLVSRTLNMIEQFASDLPLTTPRGTGKGEREGVANIPPSTPQGTGKGDVGGFALTVDNHIEQLAFDKALAAIWEAISWADELIEKTKPWELVKQGKDKEAAEVLSQLFATLVAINTAIAPLLPETHEKLTALLSARPIIKPQEPLFARKN